MTARTKNMVLDAFGAVGVEIGGTGPRDIAVHDERFYDRIVADGALGMGESYQQGWFDANDLAAFLTVMVSNDLAKQVKPSPAAIRAAVEARVRNRQDKRRAEANAQAHYDIGNDLYQRMLDKRMIYSCGYWETATDLDAAQEAKLDLICRKLGFEPGMRVLDIGCGWGGFVQFAVERYDVSAVGISLATEQVSLARERTAGLDIEIRLQDYRDVAETFDRVVSIGMFEHVGPRNYAGFFEACDRMLAPDGMMLHHTIGGLESKTRTDPWFDKYIFPGGVLPSLAQIGKATEQTWVLEDLHNFGPDYETTLLRWHENATAAWPDLPHYDEHFRRTWDYYLLGSAAGFRARSSQLWQMVFRRSKRPAPRYRTVR